MKPPRVGISSCLLGIHVRYDGGHKRQAFAAGPLGRRVELVSVCPEVEAGMGVPREPVRLQRTRGRIRMVGVDSGTDHTEAMEAYARHRVASLEALDLSGYIFKKNSPSCGPRDVPVAGSTAPAMGLFAAALRARMPDLPVVDESDLADRDARHAFLEQVYAHRRVTDFFAAAWTLGGLVEFHSDHKLLLMAHDVEVYRDLGRLVARAKSMSRPALEAAYRSRFLKAINRPATRGRHVNVLQHIAGYFKDLPAAQREEMRRRIERYREGALSLEAVRGYFLHWAWVCGIAYLEPQAYLEPVPPPIARSPRARVSARS